MRYLSRPSEERDEVSELVSGPKKRDSGAGLDGFECGRAVGGGFLGEEGWEVGAGKKARSEAGSRAIRSVRFARADSALGEAELGEEGGSGEKEVDGVVADAEVENEGETVRETISSIESGRSSSIDGRAETVAVGAVTVPNDEGPARTGATMSGVRGGCVAVTSSSHTLKNSFSAAPFRPNPPSTSIRPVPIGLALLASGLTTSPSLLSLSAASPNLPRSSPARARFSQTVRSPFSSRAIRSTPKEEEGRLQRSRGMRRSERRKSGSEGQRRFEVRSAWGCERMDVSRGLVRGETVPLIEKRCTVKEAGATDRDAVLERDGSKGVGLLDLGDGNCLYQYLKRLGSRSAPHGSSAERTLCTITSRSFDPPAPFVRTYSLAFPFPFLSVFRS